MSHDKNSDAALAPVTDISERGWSSALERKMHEVAVEIGDWAEASVRAGGGPIDVLDHRVAVFRKASASGAVLRQVAELVCASMWVVKHIRAQEVDPGVPPTASEGLAKIVEERTTAFMQRLRGGVSEEALAALAGDKGAARGAGVELLDQSMLESAREFLKPYDIDAVLVVGLRREGDKLVAHTMAGAGLRSFRGRVIERAALSAARFLERLSGEPECELVAKGDRRLSEEPRRASSKAEPKASPPAPRAQPRGFATKKPAPRLGEGRKR